MTDFGHYSLLCALTLALLAVAFGIYAGRSQSRKWLIVTRNA